MRQYQEKEQGKSYTRKKMFSKDMPDKVVLSKIHKKS